MRSLLGTLVVVAVAVVVFSLLARAAGFHVNLVWALILSLGLTLVLNLVTRAVQGSRRG
jgi:low affinity Fe/Cu permease